MAETQMALVAPTRPDFILQLSYAVREGELMRTLVLLPRARSAATHHRTPDFHRLHVVCECALRARDSGRAHRLLTYRVTDTRPVAGADSPRQGRALWLEPAGDLALHVETLARRVDAQGTAVFRIRLTWPDGIEERYERTQRGSIWFIRS